MASALCHTLVRSVNYQRTLIHEAMSRQLYSVSVHAGNIESLCITVLHTCGKSNIVKIGGTVSGIKMKGKSGKFGPRLTISLTGSDYATLNAHAAKDQVSASWVVRRAINEYLHNHRDKLARGGAFLGARGKRSSASVGQYQER
jgi:hypothetical protein